jgi:hypothetical protein
MGAGGATMRAGVDSPGGWETLLQLFAERVKSGAEAVEA